MFLFHHGSWINMMLKLESDVAMLCTSACIAFVEWLMFMLHIHRANLSLGWFPIKLFRSIFVVLSQHPPCLTSIPHVVCSVLTQVYLGVFGCSCSAVLVLSCAGQMRLIVSMVF